MKSFVWYSPQAFKDKGYEVPKTWAELLALSDKIAADNPGGDVKPWCAGIESGDGHRLAGHGLDGGRHPPYRRSRDLRQVGRPRDPVQRPCQSPLRIAEVGKILKNDKYVNGGFGDVKTIASTAFQDAGQPILEGACYMHRQASFYAANWPEGTKVAP